MVLALVAVSRGIGVAFLDVVSSPWWWYVHGLPRVTSWSWRGCCGWEETIGLRLWAKNLFTPMFGQTDFSGRLISFGMRLVVLVARTATVIGVAVMFVGIVVGYILLPIVGVGMILGAWLIVR